MTETPSIRPPVRTEETPRERAARITKEILDHNAGAIDDGVDEFALPPGLEIPDGWSYEWKVQTVLGFEDPAHAVALERAGWAPVPADRHPGMMPKGHKEKVITRKGMILMERPTELVEMKRREELRRARMQVRVKEEQLTSAPPGQFERGTKDHQLVKVKRDYSPVDIPDA